MPANDDVPDKARRALVVAAVVSLVMPHVPVVELFARPWVWLQTFAHEAGHGLTALLLGADGFALKIYPDASGVAPWHASAGFALLPAGAALIAIGGLVGPAITSAFFFLAARRPAASRIALAVFAAFALVLAAVAVENIYGRVVVACWGVAFAAAAWKLGEGKAQVACAFVGINLGLSVFSRGDYLFADTAHTGAGDLPSDVVQVANGFGGLYLAWGALIGLVSVVIVALGLWLLVRGRSR